MMEIDDIQFFNKIPKAFPLYLAFKEKINLNYPDVTIIINKSMISFSNKHSFAYVWLPIRKMKERPEVYIIISFGLPYRIKSPRIVEAVEPYPNRWTHHVIAQNIKDLDDELMNCIAASYEYSMQK